MNRLARLTTWLFTFGLLVSHALAQVQGTHPYLVLLNGRSYTSNPAKPWGEALAIQGDKILVVGSANDVAPYRGPGNEVINLAGRMAMPGIIDSHTHFLAGSEALAWVNLEDAGARLAFGSDWPVASFNPFLGIQTAVTRQNLQGTPLTDGTASKG